MEVLSYQVRDSIDLILLPKIFKEKSMQFVGLLYSRTTMIGVMEVINHIMGINRCHGGLVILKESMDLFPRTVT
jgi:hypothetical protein